MQFKNESLASQSGCCYRSLSFQLFLAYILQGDIKDIVHGVPWRLADDLVLVAYNKELVPLCQFLRKLAIDNGLSEVNVPDHQVKPRMVEASQPAQCEI